MDHASGPAGGLQMSEFRRETGDQANSPNQGQNNNLDLLSVSQPEVHSITPVARWTLLAGGTAGITEAAFNKVNVAAAENLAGASREIAAGLGQGTVNYDAINRLSAYTRSLPVEANLTLGATNASTVRQVRDMLSLADEIMSADRRIFSATERIGEARKVIGAEVTALTDEVAALRAGAHGRVVAFEVAHVDRYGAAALSKHALVDADGLRAIAAENQYFHPTSTLRHGLLERAAKMAPGETVSPFKALNEMHPAWAEKVAAMNKENARLVTAESRLHALNLAMETPDAVRGILNFRSSVGEQPFKVGEPVYNAMRDLHENAVALRGAKATFEANKGSLVPLAASMEAKMGGLLASEVATVQAFARGFGKGVVGMSAGIGAGYVVDQLTGNEQATLSSPVGMGIDASAGLVACSAMPWRFKAPLALTMMAVPRVLNAYDVGPAQLTPSMIASDSVWRPNAVDGLGIGLAAGLPVAGKYKLGLGVAAIIAGRLYNGVSTKPSDSNLLDTQLR